MKSFASLIFVALAGSAAALVSRSGPTQMSRTRNGRPGLTMEYIPSGMTKEQWKKIKDKESKKKVGKFDGTSGMQFRSRSFEDFQKGREDGRYKYNMPMEFAAEKLKKGIIKPEDIPYMQRKGGMADDSDLKKKFKFPWQK